MNIGKNYVVHDTIVLGRLVIILFSHSLSVDTTTVLQMSNVTSKDAEDMSFVNKYVLIITEKEIYHH